MRNQSHSCGDHSVERFLADKSRYARSLFRRFETLIADCGPYAVAPTKTRVAYMAQVRFASVNRVAERHLDIHFVLPRSIRHARIRRVEKIGRMHVHHVRVSTPEDLDRELAGWLRKSYVEYGRRGWLQNPRR